MNLSSIPTGAAVLLCLLCCVARLWGANHDDGDPLIRLGEPPLRRQLVPFPNLASRRYLQSQTAYVVEVHLALYYVTEDIALAMESKDPTSPVVAHFCRNFNQQASGPQVVEAASAEAGAVYETRILDTADDATQDYDCQVIQSNRISLDDTTYNIPDDQFILEVFANQIVFVTSDRTVSNDEVYNTVVQGFNRGTGGRVRFLTLLKRMDAFSTLLDFEVLEGGFSILQNLPTVPSRSPSPTSSPPSQPPSHAPTTRPSHEPSWSPSSSPSLSPSSVRSSSPVESSTSPTRAPSRSPSKKPEITLDPTIMPPTTQPTVLGAGAIDQPTQQPSKFPTNTGEDSQTAPAETSSSDDRKGLILGAIAGGVATIFVSCFFIFCVWFPLCGKPRSERSVPAERRPQQGSVSSSQSDGAEAAAAMIPGVVNLVDENASLADTTLGDQTMGLLPPKKIKRLGDTDNFRMLDSFDDNSLYTSSVAPTSALGGSSEASEPSDQSFYSHGNSMLLPPSLDNTLDYEQDIIFPTSHSASDSGGDGEEIELRRVGVVELDEEEIRVVTVVDDSDQSDVVSYGKPDDGSIDPVKEPDVDYKSETESEIDREGFNMFDAIPAARSDEEKARDFSQNMDRDDYDPFAEDTSGTSSFGFDNIEPLDVNSANPYGPPQEIPDDRSSPSSSSQTKRIENLILGSISHSSDNQERLGAASDQVEDRDVDESSGVKDRKGSNDSDRSPPRDFFSNYEEANNSLLRSVLEDARLMAESKSPSLPSRTSRKSAPPRMLKPSSTKPKATTATTNLEVGKDTAKPGKARGTSSMSVGGEPRPRDARDKGEPAPKPPTRPTQNARSRDVSYDNEFVGDVEDDVAGPSNFLPPYRTRFLDRVAVMKPHHFLPTGSGGRSGSISTAPSRLKNKMEIKLPETPKLSTSPLQGEVTSVASETSSIPSSAGGSASGTLGAQPRSYFGEGWSATSDDSVMHQASESEESSLFTPESSPGVLGIASQLDEGGRKMLDDAASADSDGSSNHWLFDAVEQTLGPRSPVADMNSLSGRSTRSEKSHKSTHSNRSSKSHQAEKKSSSRSKSDVRKHSPSQKDYPFNSINTMSSSIVVSLPSGNSLDEHKSESDEVSITPRTLELDLKRLEMQLADVLQTEMDQITTSSIAASSAAGSAYSAKRRAAAKKSNKNHVVIVVPPGKLGVVLANRHDGKGTVVAEVRPHSSMRGVLSPGDRVVAVDGKDVTNMIVGEVTKLMATRSNAERRLTVITSAPPSGRDMDEAKVQEHA